MFFIELVSFLSWDGMHQHVHLYHDVRRIKRCRHRVQYVHTLGSQSISMNPRLYGCHGNPIVLQLSLSKLLLPVDVTGWCVQATMATLVFWS